MPLAIVNGKLVRVPYGYRLPESKRKIKNPPEERKPEEQEGIFEKYKPEKSRLPKKRRFHVTDNADGFKEAISHAVEGKPNKFEQEKKSKSKEKKDHRGGARSEEAGRYGLALLRGEEIKLFGKTKVAKNIGKKTYETDETPYGRIDVTNDDLAWRTNPFRKAHHDGMLFLTDKRLVHVVKQGWAHWAKYTVDFDRPLSTLHNAAIETGDGWKRKFNYPGKRLAVQYYKGDVDMFGDTILAKRGEPLVEERKERTMRTRTGGS